MKLVLHGQYGSCLGMICRTRITHWFLFDHVCGELFKIEWMITDELAYLRRRRNISILIFSSGEFGINGILDLLKWRKLRFGYWLKFGEISFFPDRDGILSVLLWNEWCHSKVRQRNPTL